MELDAVRMVADWLKKGTNGSTGTNDGPSSVNALLGNVPRDPGDVLPSNVTVYDSTRDGWVARLHVPYEAGGISYPAVAVFPAADPTFDGEITTNLRDGTADIACMIVDERSDSAPGLASALYTARAILRSLKLLSDQLNQGPLYDTVCRRNSVALRGCQSLRLARGGITKSGIVLQTGVIATYHIRDEAP